MKTKNKSTNIDINISYSSLWGQALLAANFACEIEHCFGIPVHTMKRDDGIFEVLVNGESIYREHGDCDPNRDPGFLFHRLKKYTDQILARDNSRENLDKDDPDHREWMRSICSGE